jgi:lactose/L-arabinose transport system permease protein
MKKKKFITNIFLYAFLTLAFVVSVFPFYWMLTGMTNSSMEIITGKMTFGNEFFNNVKALFDLYDVKLIFLNSVKISVITVLLSLVVTSMAAYGFEMYQSKTREITYSVIILAMMVPFAALMIPLFKLVTSLQMLNTHTGLIITGIASIFLIFFFRQNFKSFPKEIIQAARVDGAGELKTFFSIVMPSMKSTYAAAAIFAFMTSWNSYLWPLIILMTDDKKTMQQLLSVLSTSYTPQYGSIMVAIVITTLPMVLIFFALQKHFVQGMTGSVKG